MRDDPPYATTRSIHEWERACRESLEHAEHRRHGGDVWRTRLRLLLLLWVFVLAASSVAVLVVR